MTTIAHPELEGLERYKFGWADSDTAGVRPSKLTSAGGLSPASSHCWPWTSATSPISGMMRQMPSTWPAGQMARNTFAGP